MQSMASPTGSWQLGTWVAPPGPPLHPPPARRTPRQHIHQRVQQLGQRGADVATVRPGVLAAQPDLAHLRSGAQAGCLTGRPGS